jgi:hypothetical protein
MTHKHDSGEMDREKSEQQRDDIGMHNIYTIWKENGDWRGSYKSSSLDEKVSI